MRRPPHELKSLLGADGHGGGGFGWAEGIRAVVLAGEIGAIGKEGRVIQGIWPKGWWLDHLHVGGCRAQQCGRQEDVFGERHVGVVDHPA